MIKSKRPARGGYGPIKTVAVLGAATVLLAACGGGGDDHDGHPPSPDLKLTSVSSMPQFVTDADVLIELEVPAGVSGTPVVHLNGDDVSSVFSSTGGGKWLGLVSSLDLGDNELSAKVGDSKAKLTLTNYPITGPMISGPHIAPFICQTEAFTLPDGSRLGAATDENCSAPTKVNYVYRSTTGGTLIPLADTSALPADVAMTTTSTGTRVPFVVRVETGTMNRGIYQNAILHDPTKEAEPNHAAPPQGWNKRLIAYHGSGCTGGWYVQGANLGANLLAGDNVTRLGEGYALFINTLNHPSNSCNATLAGETTMMGKEHFIETFGVPFYTVSTGGSGGAYTSLQVGDALPGIFDGVLVSATFPDALSIALSGLDSRLLSNYYLTNNTATFNEAQIVAVSGHKTARAWYDLALQSGRTDPVPNRIDPIPPSTVPGLGAPYNSAVWNAAVPLSLRYDPISNPGGARPTVFDVARNVYGVNASTGFALRPFDNVGVQYGLAALNAGTITPTQFIELNEKIGGYDQDANYVPARTRGDAGAIRRAYQSGLNLNGNGGLASIPVFDFSGIYDDDNLYHYQWFHFAVRERMAHANGNTDNHVMWRGGASIISAVGGGGTPEELAIDQAVDTKSWATFIQWMEAYKSDSSSASQKEKVVKNKPAMATDGCFTKSTSPGFIAEKQTFSRAADSQCNQLWPSYSAPRLEAEGPLAANKLKCNLKPVEAADYQVAFSTPEFTRLKAIFPDGVCDWSKPGVEQTGTVPYASFGPSPANQVFDITEH